MDEDLKPQRVAISIHAVAAIAMGYLSLIIASMYRSLYSIIIGFVLLIVIGFITERIVGEKKGIKWWFGNGGFIYILIWVVVWVLLFNL